MWCDCKDCRWAEHHSENYLDYCNKYSHCSPEQGCLFGEPRDHDLIFRDDHIQYSPPQQSKVIQPSILEKILQAIRKKEEETT